MVADDLTRTPGGSNGGTRAGVAANFATAGVGTDTINSIRSPASAWNSTTAVAFVCRSAQSCSSVSCRSWPMSDLMRSSFRIRNGWSSLLARPRVTYQPAERACATRDGWNQVFISSCTYRLPRDQEAAAAIKHTNAPKMNVSVRPAWKGPEIRLEKNE